MYTRTLNREPVTEVGLGCWQIGGGWGRPWDDATAQQIMRAAYDAGVRLFDTADVYGDGDAESERSVGRFLAALSAEQRAGVFVATKLGRNGLWLDRAALLAASAADCVDLVTRTHRLETARNRQAEDLSTLRFEAYTDPLTKTLNRRGFFDLARQRLEKHCGDLSACCMLLDLNRFKPVNDAHGHEVGDLVLRGLAKLLRRSVSRTDLIGRLGGDEFVVLITDLSEPGAQSAAQRLYDTCHNAQLRVSDELTLQLRLSLGAVFEPRLGEGAGLDQMLAAADELMYRQKRTGRPGLRFGRVTPDLKPAPGDLDRVDVTPASPRHEPAASGVGFDATT